MANIESRVTIHMAASLDGFIARRDGSVDWLETSDEFADGVTMDAGFVEAFLKTIDCYVMGSRTYETALRFEAQGLGWSYGDKPTFVLTRRELPRARETVEFYSGDLAQLVNWRLRASYRSIWVVGGGAVAGRFPAQRDAALCRRPVTDDDAARLVRVLGSGVLDDRPGDIARQLDGLGAGVARHGQLTR